MNDDNNEKNGPPVAIAFYRWGDRQWPEGPQLLHPKADIMSLCQFHLHSWLPTPQAPGVLGYKGTMGLGCSRLVEERLLNLSGGPTLSSPYLLLFGFWITQCAQTVCTPKRIFAGPDVAFCVLQSLTVSGKILNFGGRTTLSRFALHALVEILHLASSLFRILRLA